MIFLKKNLVTFFKKKNNSFFHIYIANQVIEKVQNLNPDNIVGVLQALRQLMKSYDIVKPTKKARDPCKIFHPKKIYTFI